MKANLQKKLHVPLGGCKGWGGYGHYEVQGTPKRTSDGIMRSNKCLPKQNPSQKWNTRTYISQDGLIDPKNQGLCQKMLPFIRQFSI